MPPRLLLLGAGALFYPCAETLSPPTKIHGGVSTTDVISRKLYRRRESSPPTDALTASEVIDATKGVGQTYTL
nr:MAG TPA: hypothetical protein [Caudoviricetes sp.]